MGFVHQSTHRAGNHSGLLHVLDSSKIKLVRSLTTAMMYWFDLPFEIRSTVYRHIYSSQSVVLDRTGPHQWLDAASMAELGINGYPSPQLKDARRWQSLKLVSKQLWLEAETVFYMYADFHAVLSSVPARLYGAFDIDKRIQHLTIHRRGWSSTALLEAIHRHFSSTPTMMLRLRINLGPMVRDYCE